MGIACQTIAWGGRGRGCASSYVVCISSKSGVTRRVAATAILLLYQFMVSYDFMPPNFILYNYRKLPNFLQYPASLLQTGSCVIHKRLPVLFHSIPVTSPHTRINSEYCVGDIGDSIHCDTIANRGVYISKVIAISVKILEKASVNIPAIIV